MLLFKIIDAVKYIKVILVEKTSKKESEITNFGEKIKPETYVVEEFKLERIPNIL